MERIVRFIANRHWTVLLALAAVTALALMASSRVIDYSNSQLRIDPSLNRLLPADSPERERYEFYRKLFGSDETMIVALSDPRTIFTAENLARIQRMSERIEALPEVHHVVSLTSATNLRGSEGSIDVRPFVTEIPEDPVELERIAREALDNPIYAGNLVSKDGRTTALVVYFLNFSDADFIELGIDERIEVIAREEAGDTDVWLAGGPHIKVAQFNYQNGDLRRALPLCLLAAAIVLAVSFRTVRGVAVPMLTVVVSLIWTMGIAGLIGRPFNAVTSLIPILFVILPLSYCIHVVSEYYDSFREKPDASASEASELALSRVSRPVVLTGVTTGAGFLALVISPIDAIGEFGMLAVAGILATVVASLTVPPAVLGALGRSPRDLRSAGEASEDRFTRFATRMAAFDLENRRAIFATTAAVVAVAALLATRIEVGAQGIKTFPADSRVRLDFDAVNQNLEGANIFNVVLKGAEPGVFRAPTNLLLIEDFQEWLESQHDVGGTTSVVEYVKLCHRAFFENDPERLVIPESRRLLVQLLFFCSSDELEGFVDARFQYANVIVRANVIDTELVSDLTDRIEARLAELPEHLTAEVTGNPILINRLFDDIVRGQAQSVLLAFVLIFAVLWVMFLDRNTAAKALIPNAVPVAFYFGALGLTGITLNFATSLIAPMALGIAIDDTIHYFSRFTEDAKRLADERKATVRALRTVGRPVTFTTVVLCVGFSILMASDLSTFVQFGALGAATLAFAWIVDFTLTPALCAGLRIVTLWDTLSLDLGSEPQKEIPLFKGLSNAYSRIIAQMASLREVPPGQSLMREGVQGNDMYVIIDGEVDVWADRDGGRRHLNKCKRGDVLGEVRLFTGEASANAAAVDHARLLRFTPKNLERLRRRHPRIASAFLENLNEYQAKRLADATRREASAPGS